MIYEKGKLLDSDERQYKESTDLNTTVHAPVVVKLMFNLFLKRIKRQKSIVNTPRKYTMCHMKNWKVLFVI